MLGQKTYHLFPLLVFMFSVSLLAQDRPINQSTSVMTVGDFFRSDNIRYATGFNKLDWYGSGDVNNDEKIDNDDLSQIQGSTSYRADVDGDGTPGTVDDRVTLENYLNGISDNLPGHWDKLQTPEERVSWLQKMIPIERKIREGQTYTQSPDGWISSQSFINFNGISDISNYIKKTKNNLGVTIDSTANGLFNIPARYLGLRNEGGQFDSNNLQILKGGNSLDVKNYYSFAPKDGEKISHDKILDYDYVSVGSLYKYDSGETDFTFEGALVKFAIENKEQKEINYMRYFILRNSPYESNIILTSPNDKTIDKTAYEQNPDLLSDFYGVPSVTSIPSEGEDFYWVGYIDGVHDNLIKGGIKNKLEKSIVDTTYLNADSTIFSVKKQFKGIQSEVDSVGRKDLGFWGYAKHLLDEDSVYQNITVDLTTDVPRENNLEKKFEVYQNYPNPFNPSTTIKFTIPNVEMPYRASLQTKLIIYDILGREVKTLINEQYAPGAYEIEFEGSNLPSGIYFYRLTSGSHTKTLKMMLLK